MPTRLLRVADARIKRHSDCSTLVDGPNYRSTVPGFTYPPPRWRDSPATPPAPPPGSNTGGDRGGGGEFGLESLAFSSVQGGYTILAWPGVNSPPGHRMHKVRLGQAH